MMLKLLPILALVAVSCNAQPSSKPDVIIETSFGNIEIRLYDETPKHKANFLKLAREGFYDNTTFHRVIQDFMIQGGDPNTRDTAYKGPVGQGGPGYTLPAEFNPNLLHKRGALAAARLGDNVNPGMESSGSQFYIVQGKVSTDPEMDQIQSMIQNKQLQAFAFAYFQEPARRARLDSLNLNEMQKSDPEKAQGIIQQLNNEVVQAFEASGTKPFTYTAEQRKMYRELGGTPFLDMQYTVFGEVIKGMDVLDKIAAVEKDPGDKPLKDVRMKVRVP